MYVNAMHDRINSLFHGKDYFAHMDDDMSTREYMPSWRSFFLSLIVCFVASASIESLQKLNLTENLLCILDKSKIDGNITW